MGQLGKSVWRLETSKFDVHFFHSKKDVFEHANGKKNWSHTNTLSFSSKKVNEARICPPGLKKKQRDHRDHRDTGVTFLLFHGQVGKLTWLLKSQPNPGAFFSNKHMENIGVARKMDPGNSENACDMEKAGPVGQCCVALEKHTTQICRPGLQKNTAHKIHQKLLTKKIHHLHLCCRNGSSEAFLLRLRFFPDV